MQKDKDKELIDRDKLNDKDMLDLHSNIDAHSNVVFDRQSYRL